MSAPFFARPEKLGVSMKPEIYHRMFGYPLERLPNPRLAELEQGVRNTDEARENSGFSIGYPGWGLIYHVLLCHLDRSRRELIIETGTNYGCTTIVLAQALKDAGCEGEVVSFEIEADNLLRARRNLELAGLDSCVRLVEGDSRTTIPKFLGELGQRGGTLRFALLDASHLFDDVMAEFNAILPHLTDDAIVVFDNTYRIAEAHEDQRVNGALKQIMRSHGGNVINFEYVSWFTPGLAIWQKRPNL